jgi:ATP-dependent Clp protease ATP-binding subunit ClpC
MSHDLVKRVAEQAITLKFTSAAIDVVAKAGFDPEYGARPIRRALQTEVEDRLSEAMLGGQIKIGDTVVVGSTRGKIKVSVQDDQHNSRLITTN